MGYYQSQQVPGHGHAPPLDTRSGPVTSVPCDLAPRKTQQSRLFHKTACTHSSPAHAVCVSPPNILTDQPSSSVSIQLELRGCVESWGNPEVTGIPHLDYSTSRRQLTSTQAEVAYITKTPITIKPVACTN